MKLTATSILLCMIAILSPTHGACIDAWEAWKTKYGKSYGSALDEREHRTIWENNAKLVAEHNAMDDVSFRLELNSLADQKISRSAITLDTPPSEPLLFETLSHAPDTWDWRLKGAVGPVQNQGQLGDALSSAATECVQSYNYIHKGDIESLSVPETHDCCVKQPIAGVNAIFDCIRDIGGLCSQAAYPKSAGKCMNTSCTAVAKIYGGKTVAKGDESALRDAVFITPVLAVIDASKPSFQLYRTGIYSDRHCSSTQLDHAVQVVGYGSENGRDYWICKNSWGANWGMNGYIQIARNDDNMCGIASMASYPV